jgi:hypothetical protein
MEERIWENFRNKDTGMAKKDKKEFMYYLIR